MRVLLKELLGLTASCVSFVIPSIETLNMYLTFVSWDIFFNSKIFEPFNKEVFVSKITCLRFEFFNVFKYSVNSE